MTRRRAPVGLVYQNIVTGLIARRLRLGWTQADLAAAAGVTKQRISTLESGRHVPSVATMIAVGRAMGYAFRWIEVETNPPWVASPNGKREVRCVYNRRPGPRFDRRSKAAQIAIAWEAAR